MLVGELGVGLTAIGFAAGSAKVAVPGLLIYAAGPPTVHALNGSNRKAWGSVLLHLGLPLLGAGVGALTAASLRRHAPGWAFFGMEIGIVSAPIADGLFLGWARAPDTTAPPKPSAAPVFAYAPAPNGGLGDVVVGAGGTF